jgi:hypothetical protein
MPCGYRLDSNHQPQGSFVQCSTIVLPCWPGKSKLKEIMFKSKINAKTLRFFFANAIVGALPVSPFLYPLVCERKSVCERDCVYVCGEREILCVCVCVCVCVLMCFYFLSLICKTFFLRNLRMIQ